MKKTQHLIIDGQNLFYRGYYSGKMVDKQGQNVTGIFNFMKMLNVLLTKFKPKYCIVTWDLGRSRRYDIYPEYKSGRREKMTKEDKENIAWQISQCKMILKALPVKQVQVMDVEADDIIGYLSKKAKGTKVIVSSDHDLIQLVTKETSVYLPKEAKLLTLDNVDKFLGIPLCHYLLFKAVMGDSSDTIKGINKMGPVKTKQFINSGDLTLKPEWLPIVERNFKLMDVGRILTKEDIKIIRKSYKEEKGKDINPLLPRRIFTNLRFRSIVSRYNTWVLPFRKLGR